MLNALVKGTTDPVLSLTARGRLRTKIPALREALQGRFDPQHVLVVGRILAHINYLDEPIDELSRAIAQQLGPFAPAVKLITTIPGVQRRSAEVIIAETGGDMSAFPTAKHLALLGRRVSRQRRVCQQAPLRQDPHRLQLVRHDLAECGKAASRTKKTYLAAQYARLRARRGANKATVAIAHSILTAVWHMLRTGET